MSSPPAASSSLQSAAQGASVTFERDRGVTQIRITRGVAHITARFAEADLAGQRLALLKSLAAADISVFLVKLHPDAMSFAVRADVVDRCETLLAQRGVNCVLLRDLALIATIAGAMRDLSGVMARIYEAMISAGVQVRQTGDAYNAVLCLVAGDQADRAADALKTAFSLPDTPQSAPVGEAAREGVILEPL